MTANPNTLVLDFGGVITRTLFETHELSEKTLGIPAGTLNWRGPFDPENDALWRSMQAGKITERNYWEIRTKEVSDLVGKDWQNMQDFVIAARSTNPMEIIRPEALAAIKSAKQAGCKLAILSNELDLFYGKDFRPKLPFLQDFDLIIDATYTKVLKPDPKAYQFITDDLQVTAETCVFVDDQMKNIQGGLDFGMKTVHFDVKDPRASYAEALSLLNIKD